MAIDENKPYVLRIGPTETPINERYALVVESGIAKMTKTEVLDTYVANANMDKISNEDLPKIRALQTKLSSGKNLTYAVIDGKMIGDSNMGEYISYVPNVDANVLDIVIGETNKGGLEGIL